MMVYLILAILCSTGVFVAMRLFERFNLATPRSVVEQAMGQLKAAFDKLEQ